VDGGGTITAVVFVALYLGAAIYMIYDPETVGSTTGFIGHSAITKPTPPQLVRFAGCAMLALPFGLLAGSVWWPLGVVCGIAGATALYYAAKLVWPL